MQRPKAPSATLAISKMVQKATNFREIWRYFDLKGRLLVKFQSNFTKSVREGPRPRSTFLVKPKMTENGHFWVIWRIGCDFSSKLGKICPTLGWRSWEFRTQCRVFFKMWNGMRFQDSLKKLNFRKADPVGWSLSAWVGVQCFRPFWELFVNLATLKSRQIGEGEFRRKLNLFVKRSEGRAFLAKIAKIGDFWPFKAQD